MIGGPGIREDRDDSTEKEEAYLVIKHSEW